MRLLPMKEPDRSWRSIKGQWKKDAESVGEDFSTFSTGSFTAYDSLTKDGDHPSLYCLSDGERIHAACQVSRLMMSKFPNPILRARFIVVSPIYELGIAKAGQYAQMMVALFSGIQGAALLANALRDPELMTSQVGHLERWIDSVA